MRIDLNIIIENYRKIVLFVFVVLMAVLLASITNNVIAIVLEKDFKIAPSKESEEDFQKNLFRKSRRLSHYSAITERNIFDSQNRQPEEKPEITRAPEKEKKAYSGPPVRSSMNATLVGTMVFSDPAYSFAKVAKGSSSDAESYYIGDTLLGEAKISKIERNRVYFRRDGRVEYLEIEGPKATVMPSYSSKGRGSVSYAKEPAAANTPEFSKDDVREVGDGKYILNKQMIDKLMANYNSILTQARAVPNFVDGKVNGFKIFAIKRNSVYQAIGVKNGDIITRVNGNDLNNPEKIMALFNQLRNEGNISLDIIRRGQKKTYEYEIR